VTSASGTWRRRLAGLATYAFLYLPSRALMQRSLGLLVVATGVTLLSMKRLQTKPDDRMPAEIDDCWSSYSTTLGRLI